MIHVVKGFGSFSGVIKEVIGVEGPAIPPISRIAVPLIATGLGNVVDLRAGQLAILSGIAVADDRGLLQFVGAQQQVGGA